MERSPTSDNIAISVNNISKIYKLYNDPLDRLKESLHPFKKKYHKEFYALNDISLDVKKGEIVGVIGENGSGKSTLLKVLTGVLTPSFGHYHVEGKISALLELGSGFNLENTGLQNIFINGAINGFTTDEMEQKSLDIIEFADIGDFINQPVKTYSSGMRARLAFSVASHIDPEILIIDEILSVGDAAFQRKCFAKIEAFKNAGKTILFVSHSDKQIVELCDQAIWLSHGKKVIEGSPKLVTGLYAKYSKKKFDVEKIILEYKKLNNRNIKNNKSTHKDNINTPEDFFNKQLIPKSTIQYEEKGAKISDVMITTLKGNKVNTLSHGEKYLLRCQTEINEDTSKIRMGFSFKTAEGVNFGGGQYPYWKTKNGMSLQKGTYLLEWQFKCNFIEGIYFINNGVFSLSESEYLHKIVDSVMFKVINHTSTQSGGRIDFNIKAKLEKLNSTG